jgi:hypothetical protein
MVPVATRPLTILAALAAADVLGKSAAGRTIAAFRHRWSGRLPRR